MESITQGWPDGITNYHKTTEHTGHSEMTCEALVNRQRKNGKKYDIARNYDYF